ncbi:uncharacterized protein LOC135709127 [Ochlerotatus camptorhynchus]|uniref:uncharacterized protein LOC135709127 n=1 Tax=Ochlerotatus camptorhynchus TaxID=644619 RepID=UPI0031DDC917
MSLIIRILFVAVVLISANEGGDGEGDHPGRARYFRFSQHRQRNVQPNEFYQLSMNANLVACGGGNSSDYNDEEKVSSGDAHGEATTVTTSGIDGCQHKIVAEIYIETTTTTRGHRSWDTYDMHLHFLLDEVYLPDNGTYGRPRDPFAINVTLEVTYARYQLRKVQVLNCYVTSRDQSNKSTTVPTKEEEQQQESSKQNTNEMVSSPAPPQQDREQDNAGGGKFSDSAETKNQDYITEEPNDAEQEEEEEEEEFYDDDDGGLQFQGNAADVYDDGGEYDDDYDIDADNGHTWSGNEDEDPVIHKFTSFSQTNRISINSKMVHPAWARKMNNGKQHFPNHFSHTNEDDADFRAARRKLQLTSTNPRTTSVGHVAGGRYRWRHQSSAINGANGAYRRRPQSYFDNYHHSHFGGGIRPSRAHSRETQLKR